jgi:hypothetical protein
MILEVGQYLLDMNRIVYIDHYKSDGYSVYFTNGKALLIAEKEMPYKTFVEKYKEAKGIKD